MTEPRSSSLHFDPDHHPDDTLKAFHEFVQDFELRYEASYPDPPKVSLDTALERWRLTHEDQKPTLEQYDNIIDEWKSKDRVSKFLGIYSSRRMFSDWKAALPGETDRKSASWTTFVKTMTEFYKPTENLTLKNFQFRAITQDKNEVFTVFCNRVEKEAKHCQFKCSSEACTAEMTSIRDQIVIGCCSDEIREEALKKSWELAKLRKEGMRIESAAKGASEITGDAALNKIGKYSFRNTKKKESKAPTPRKANCYFCGIALDRKDIPSHAKQCPAKNAVCSNCNKVGHYAKVCKSEKSVHEVSLENSEDEESSIYNVNIFRLQRQDVGLRPDPNKDDFKVQLIINNHLDSVLADTGARVSVCGVNQARKWNLLEKMTSTHAKRDAGYPLQVSGQFQRGW